MANGDDRYPRCWRLDETGGIFYQYTLEGQNDALRLNPELRHDIGQYRFIAIVRDAAAGIHRIYVDGQLEAENSEPPDVQLQSGDLALELGRGQFGHYRGLLDEFRVAERVIPSAWIEADMRTWDDPLRVLSSVGEPERVPCGGSG